MALCLKMAPLGKKFEKMDMLQMAKVAGCAYVATVVPNNPRRVESVIKKAVLIAREVGSTYIQAYTSCNIEYAIPTDKVMEDAKTVENDRYQFTEYVSDEAKQYLTERYGYKEFLPKPAAPAADSKQGLSEFRRGGSRHGKTLQHSNGRSRWSGCRDRVTHSEHRSDPCRR